MIDQITHLDHLYRIFIQVQLRHWAGHPLQSRFAPGVDNETLPAFARHLDQNLSTIAEQLQQGRYRFSPFLERKVTPSGGREKRFCRATLRDTIVQKAIAAVVEPVLDAALPDNLHSFRRRRPGGPGMHQALSQATRASQAQRYWVLQEDVRAYFDHIRHDLLLETLSRILLDHQVIDLYAAYLAAPRQIKDRIHPRQKGLPIGSILANGLSNIYLLPLDRAMEQAGLRYLRYCDDLLVIADSESEALEARALIAETVAARGLDLNPQKSALAAPGDQFVYLGYEFQGPQIRIGQRALAKFRRKVQQVTARKHWPRLTPADLETPQGQAVLARLIRQVNQLIAGNSVGTWPRYYARADFDGQFRELDTWIRQRVRAALFHRWRESDARYLPTQRLQALGLRSLVGQAWRWRQAWKQRQRALLTQAAELERLREALEKTKARSWNKYRRRHHFRPGPDGLTLEDIAGDERGFLLELQTELLNGTYHFGPFFEYARPRQGREEPRWIARPGLADAVVSRSLAATLSPHLEPQLPCHVHSYRYGKGDWTAIGQLHRWLLAHDAPWIVRVDVAGFLDQINLSQLEKQLDQALPDEKEQDNLLRTLLQSYLWGGRWQEAAGLLARQRGLPRGGPLTPLLSNLYLLPLDQALARAEFRTVRYADDIVVVAANQQEAQAAWDLIQEQAGDLNLPLSPTKSDLLPPGTPFEFLGYRITGQHFDIRPYAVNRLKRRVRRVTRRRRWTHLTPQSLQTTTGMEDFSHLVRQVNRLLLYGPDQNWARRFARCTDDTTFRELDHWIADRVRACVTGRWSPRNRRLVTDDDLRKMGLVKLVSLYYHARRRIAGQAAHAALVRRAVSFPEAGS